MIGQIIHYRYEVLEKIGEGAVFTVYKARDKVLNRLVALKTLNPPYANNRRFVGAVRDGYQNAAILDHLYIARVCDVDPTSEVPFVTYEYVNGIDVKERIAKAGAMQVSKALDIIIPTLEALEYAHANKMVHGNLRSQDILASPNGEIKVTDFGLSAALRECPDVSDSLSMRSIHYEAPEVAEGAAPSSVSDLYSAGVVLYEMLTGSLPFEGATAVAIALNKSKQTPTPPRSLNASVPKSLNDLVMRAIDKSPQERFASAGEMLADLRAIRDSLRTGRPVAVAQPHSRQIEPDDEPDNGGLLSRASYLWLIVGFVLVVALAGGLTLTLSTRDMKLDVPLIIGKSVEEAREIAHESGLTLEQDHPGEVYSNDYEEGRIAVQFPLAHSRVPRDKAIIKFKLSKGPSVKRVPDLLGLPEPEAYRAVEDAGFIVSKLTNEYNDKIPINAVIRQDPEKGSMAPPQSSIALVLSLGPKPEQPSEPSYTQSPQPKGDPRSFQIAVTVPADADGQQEVRIVVNDERGSTTAVQEYHDPGDKFSETVTAYGDNVRIRVYVGGRLASDEKY